MALVRVLSEDSMCLHERLVQLLALEVQVTGRSNHAQDHESVPHESIRRASIEEFRELDEAQKVEIEEIRVGLEIEEISDRRKRSGMGHVQPGHGWGLVRGSIFQRAVELPDVPGLVRSGEHTLVQESHQDVGLLEVPILVRGLAYIREELGQGPVTSRQLEGAPSSLDPPRSSCMIPMSCMVRSTGLA
jgi:hypothetical protein